MPANGRIGVITEPLDIPHGNQEQIQRPSGVVTWVQEAMANEAVVHPTKAGRHLPLPIRSEQMFDDHKQVAWFREAATPECIAPVLPPGGPWRRCPLVT